MSAILLIAKDVLAATWSMPSKRLMGIFLRLSVVVGVIMAGVALVDMYQRYHNVVSRENEEARRIYFGLLCAQRHSDEALLKHVNQFGNFDISKVGCSKEVFWANLGEVRNLPGEPRLSDLKLSSYVSLPGAAIVGVMWVVTTIVLGLLLIFLRRVANWVIGA
jgi:hypothetical protein